MNAPVRWGVVAVALGAAAGDARAWNKPGHMVTGGIAYRVLMRDSPQVVPAVVKLLEQHPYYNDPQEWKPLVADVPAGPARDEFLFMLAARWPDDARDDKEYYPPDEDRDQWHYVNQPYRPKNQPDWVKTAPPDDINIFRGYEYNLARLADASAAPADRAVAQCWVLHLLGDCHQPLHTASLFTSKFQKDDRGKLTGDRGGTRFYVRGGTGGRPMHLHHIWDGFVTYEGKFRDNQKEVLRLWGHPDFAKDKLAEELGQADFEDWIAESFQLAKSTAYEFDGKLVRGSPYKSSAPRLPSGYTKACQPVAQRRAVLAGYRIAHVLKETLSSDQ